MRAGRPKVRFPTTVGGASNTSDRLARDLRKRYGPGVFEQIMNVVLIAAGTLSMVVWFWRYNAFQVDAYDQHFDGPPQLSAQRDPPPGGRLVISAPTTALPDPERLEDGRPEETALSPGAAAAPSKPPKGSAAAARGGPAGGRRSATCPAKRGLREAHGKCACTTLFRGPSCQVGEVYVFEEGAGATAPRLLPAGYEGDVALSKAGLRNLTTLDIYLPGKEGAWRTVGKAKAVAGLAGLVPDADPVGGPRHKRCAVVGSSASLLAARQGRQIDAHDMVLRFGTAPTKGFEEHVGAKTTLRLPDAKWPDFRETSAEALLLAPQALEQVRARLARSKHARLHLLHPDFVNYAAITAAQMTASVHGASADPVQSAAGAGPSSELTGTLLALNVCHEVTLFGMMFSEAQGFPQHYHDRCPAPGGDRSGSEWRVFKRLTDAGLAMFAEFCIAECREEDPAACGRCKAAHPEVYGAAATARGRAKWEQAPLPKDCAERVELQHREETARAQGGTARGEEKRQALLGEIRAEKAADAPASPGGGRKKKGGGKAGKSRGLGAGEGCPGKAATVLSELPRGHPRGDRTAGKAFQQWLCDTQHAQVHPRTLVFADDDDGDDDEARGEGPAAALGARMQRYSSALWAAANTERTLVDLAPGRWAAAPEGCADRGNACFFVPVAPMQSNATWRHGGNGTAHGPASLISQEAEMLWTRGTEEVFYRAREDGPEDLRKHLFPDHGGCWLAGQLLYYSMQPGADVDAAVRAEKERLGWEHPVAAIHVPAGGNTTGRVAEHMAALRELHPDLHRVLVIAEDQEVIIDALRLYPHVDILFTDRPRRSEGVPGAAAAGVGMRSLLVELYLAVDADYLVAGDFDDPPAAAAAAWWPRLWALLASAKFGCLPPARMARSAAGTSPAAGPWTFGTCTHPEEELTRCGAEAEYKRKPPPSEAPAGSHAASATTHVPSPRAGPKAGRAPEPRNAGRVEDLLGKLKQAVPLAGHPPPAKASQGSKRGRGVPAAQAGLSQSHQCGERDVACTSLQACLDRASAKTRAFCEPKRIACDQAEKQCQASARGPHL